MEPAVRTLLEAWCAALSRTRELGDLVTADAVVERYGWTNAQGALERFEVASGPPLCVMEDFEYPTSYRQLAPGELLCRQDDPADEMYFIERGRVMIELQLPGGRWTLAFPLSASRTGRV